MNCDEVRQLLDAYVDGELDLVNSLSVEAHLRDCADCARLYHNRQTLRAAIRENVSLYFAAPPALEKRLRTSLHQQQKPQHAFHLPPALWRVGLAAVVLVAVILVVGIASRLLAASADDPLVSQVIADHVRSMMVNHLADVASSDMHTVKPWFNGKLDFSPTVIDLAAQGYPLDGGRLDYLDNRPVAALVYRHPPHVINVFIYPSGENTGTAATSPEILTRQGYHLFHWTQSRMVYWAISDLNLTEMQTFVQLLQAQTAATP